MKHEIQLKLLNLMTLLGVGLTMTSCTPSINKPNLIANKEDIMMKEQAVIETYQFYEDDNNLILEMEWINHRDAAIEGSLGMRPYAVFYNEDQLADLRINPFAGTNFKPAIITIRPGESHTFTYIINTTNQFLDGTHNYDLLYTTNIYESNIVNEAKPVVKKINFTWQKFENSNKGHLISQKLVDY